MIGFSPTRGSKNGTAAMQKISRYWAIVITTSGPSVPYFPRSSFTPMSAR